MGYSKFSFQFYYKFWIDGFQFNLNLTIQGAWDIDRNNNDVVGSKWYPIIVSCYLIAYNQVRE